MLLAHSHPLHRTRLANARLHFTSLGWTGRWGMHITDLVTTSTLPTMPPSPPCSLTQWLAHQKTCPQCRERCLQRNVVKLFVDSGDSSMLNTTQSMEPQEMKVSSMRFSAQNWVFTSLIPRLPRNTNMYTRGEPGIFSHVSMM